MKLLVESLQRLVKFRRLVWHLAMRELSTKYKRSWFGVIWAILQPLLSLGVYAFVFGKLLRGRALGEGDYPYIFTLFCGLLPYQLFAEVTAASPSIVAARVQILKGALFPIEVVPLAQVVAAAIHMSIGWGLCFAFMLFGGFTPHWTAVLLPVALLPVVLFSLGLSWFLGAAGVFVGDLRQLTQIAVHLLFFLSPVFYSLETVRPAIRPWVLMNPLAVQIEVCRSLVLGAGHATFAQWSVHLGVSVLVTLVGLQFFVRRRRRFLDVI